MTYKLTLGAVIVAAFLALAAYFLVSGQQQARASYFNGTVISAATTTAATSLTTSTRVLATTTNTLGTGYTRVYASICNPSATIVALGMNQDKPLTATTQATVFIGAAAGYSVCYEITDRNMYSGSVVASSTVGAVNVFATEYVQ